MAQNLLPITFLFHATCVLLYVPMIIISFAFGGVWSGVISLGALLELGVLAALCVPLPRLPTVSYSTRYHRDIIVICRKVNLGIFLVIEISVIALLPLSVWPIILLGVCSFPAMHGKCLAVVIEHPFILSMLNSFDVSLLHYTSSNVIPFAFINTAAFAILALSVIFVLYICIAFVIDKILGNTFLPKFHKEMSPSSGIPAKPFFLGTRRTPAERAAVVDHCADYIFRHSIFRKHTYVPATAYICLLY